MNQFHTNFEGVLTSNGEVKVAKSEIYVKILHINKTENNMLLKGKKRNFVGEIHAKLKELLFYIDEGDFAFIKFRKGECWIVGFKKQSANKNHNFDLNTTADLTNSWSVTHE